MRDRGPLYLIEILHQTTTFLALSVNFLGCILSKFYIKPQRIVRRQSSPLCCILSKFYIKPQHITPDYLSYRVVSYRNSTSNHNYVHRSFLERKVVSYRNSTSNHNLSGIFTVIRRLYLIEILHQTTTWTSISIPSSSCILSKFYIKPQLSDMLCVRACCCILSKFYIKPQRRASY